MSQDQVKQAVDFITSKIPGDFKPRVALVTGSGQGALADKINAIAKINFHDIPGFFVSTVSGHAGQLVLGDFEGVPIVCMSGRVHLYEGASIEQLRLPIRMMRALGAETLLMTNAAGSLRTEVLPGSVSIVCDQINISAVFALVGPNDDKIGPRFLAMEDAYDKGLRDKFHAAAQELNIELPEGVYLGVRGPAYETPAEIRMFQHWGAHLVGMSTVNEVVIARHCGFKVVVLSAVCNLAAGLSDTKVSHEEVLENAKESNRKLIQLIDTVLPTL